jgi:hypothetical protein
MRLCEEPANRIAPDNLFKEQDLFLRKGGNVMNTVTEPRARRAARERPGGVDASGSQKGIVASGRAGQAGGRYGTNL